MNINTLTFKPKNFLLNASNKRNQKLKSLKNKNKIKIKIDQEKEKKISLFYRLKSDNRYIIDYNKFINKNYPLSYFTYENYLKRLKIEKIKKNKLIKFSKIYEQLLEEHYTTYSDSSDSDSDSEFDSYNSDYDTYDSESDNENNS